MEIVLRMILLRRFYHKVVWKLSLFIWRQSGNSVGHCAEMLNVRAICLLTLFIQGFFG